MSKDKISIAEYAELRGVSLQAVYKRLNGSLNPYLIEENGKKYLDIRVLDDEELNEVSTEVENNSTEVKQPLNNPIQPDILTEQIAEKDKVIQSLLHQIDILQEQNGKLTDLLQNTQLLMAQQQHLLLNASTNPVNVEENTPSPDIDTDDTEPDTAETPKEEKKKGFFGLFGRKKR
jgi:hypothetical protein